MWGRLSGTIAVQREPGCRRFGYSTRLDFISAWSRRVQRSISYPKIVLERAGEHVRRMLSWLFRVYKLVNCEDSAVTPGYLFRFTGGLG